MLQPPLTKGEIGSQTHCRGRMQGRVSGKSSFKASQIEKETFLWTQQGFVPKWPFIFFKLVPFYLLKYYCLSSLLGFELCRCFSSPPPFFLGRAYALK